MIRILYGTPIFGSDWAGGGLPAPPWELHRHGHRESSGLVVAICGARQGDRGNPWILAHDAKPGLNYPRCAECWSESAMPMYPDVRVEIPEGSDAFQVMGLVRRAMRIAGVPGQEVQRFYDEVLLADDLLGVCRSWVEVT